MKFKFESFGGAWPPSKTPPAQKFSQNEMDSLIAGFYAAVACSSKAVAEADNDFKLSEKLLKAFFARQEDREKVKAGLKKMNDFLLDKNRTITFVDARGQTQKLLRCCERAVPGVPGAHGATQNVYSAPYLAPMTAGDYAYVNKLAHGDPDANTVSHVGSGMRIYIGERGFHPSKTLRDTADTVYHEINHKVLGTVDHKYGVPDCKDIANTEKAVECAASWGLFVTAYEFVWPHLDWDPKELVQTRSRSNAVSRSVPGNIPQAQVQQRSRSNAMSGGQGKI